ncbi:MAG: ATP-binding protein [Nitrososphaerota archaeon]|nr:ATP-binding protein [Nitrososphaerota archaeon]
MDSFGTRVCIGETHTSPSATVTLVTLDNSFYDEALLFRIVIIQSGSAEYLGIVQNVSVETEINRPKVGGSFQDMYPTVLTVRNLLHLGRGSIPSVVRNAPRPQCKVYLASEEDLDRFFPVKASESRAFVGRLRDTSYRLPLRSEVLAFANTGLIAGIGHGKSHVAAQIVLQLHLAGRKVVIVDPTSEWSTLIEAQLEGMQSEPASWVSISSFHYDTNATNKTELETFVKRVSSEFDSKKLTVIDCSLLDYHGSAEEKIQERGKLVYALQQNLMVEASRAYAATKTPYAYNGCIVLEEAHEFIPSSPEFEIQKKLNLLFSVSTKEYRKYGLGLIFIDQSLGAVFAALQVQTYLLGAPATPGDLEFLRSRLGDNLADAVQRTRREGAVSSWVAYGLATPYPGIPWEIVSFENANEVLSA